MISIETRMHERFITIKPINVKHIFTVKLSELFVHEEHDDRRKQRIIMDR